MNYPELTILSHLLVKVSTHMVLNLASLIDRRSYLVILLAT